METSTFTISKDLNFAHTSGYSVVVQINSYKQTTTDGVAGAKERIDFDLSNLPNWLSLSSKSEVTNGYTLILVASENPDPEQRSASITLTQKESNNILQIMAIQEGKPQPQELPINNITYHVDWKSQDESYDYFDIYFQAEKEVTTAITIECSIDNMGQAKGETFIINPGDTRSPQSNWKTNKSTTDLVLLEIISWDPTADETYQYQVNMP